VSAKSNKGLKRARIKGAIRLDAAQGNALSYFHSCLGWHGLFLLCRFRR